MLIDWFTVGAQVVNFLILVWLMKRFLYKPILHAIDAREKRVAKELADADAKQSEAKKERDEFDKKNREFDQQRDKMLSTAKQEVKTERERLLDEARQAADALSAKREEALRRELQSLQKEIANRSRDEVFAIARKTLADLAGTSLDERMSEVFAHRVRELNGEAKEDLAKALKTSSEPAFVRSAFDLPAGQRATIQRAVNETFSADVHIRFETAPGVIGGIELSTNGRKIAWSIADYLSSMEKSLGELVTKNDKPGAKAEPKTA
jgi:F-type H+-transporting ATPase subunit b